MRSIVIRPRPGKSPTSAMFPLTRKTQYGTCEQLMRLDDEPAEVARAGLVEHVAVAGDVGLVITDPSDETAHGLLQ